MQKDHVRNCSPRGSLRFGLLALPFLLPGSLLLAGQIVRYDFTGEPGNQGSTTPDLVVTSATATPLVRGAGLGATTSSTNTLLSTAWATTATLNPASGKYVEFKIAPQVGHTLSIKSLSVWTERSSGGPANLGIRTSLDSYASDATNVITGSPTGLTHRVFTFSSTAFADIREEITLRLYGWNATTGGSLALSRALTVEGQSAATVGPLVEYEFAGESGNQATTSADFVGGGLSASALSRGSGITGVSGTNTMGATGWSASATLDVNDYFQFTVTPQSGVSVSPEAITVTLARSTSGPKDFVIRSSRDGYVASASPEILNLSTGWQSLIFPLQPLGNFANLTTATTFRLYAWRAQSNGSVILSGTMALHGANDLVRYDFTAEPGSQVETAANIVHPNLHVEAIRRGNGITAPASAASLAGAAWTTGAVANTDDYFEFIVVPKRGYNMSLTSLTFTDVRNSTGPTSFNVRSSLDTYGTDLITTGTVTTTPTVRTIPLDDRFHGLQKGVAFRIYGWASSSGGGVWSLKDQIKLRGKVSRE